MAESWSAAELLQAGWSESDLAWERATEEVLRHAAAEDGPVAMPAAAQAVRIARADFRPVDPRLGTALANFGWCRALSGDQQGADGLVAEARQVWRRADPWIAALCAPRVARSSLFHMRMEQRHRAAYEERWRALWLALAAEARGRLDGTGPAGAPAAALARWRRERPAMLNDTRKLMAAAILLLVP